MASTLVALVSNLLITDFSMFREIAKVFKIKDPPLVTRKGCGWESSHEKDIEYAV